MVAQEATAMNQKSLSIADKTKQDAEQLKRPASRTATKAATQPANERPQTQPADQNPVAPTILRNEFFGQNVGGLSYLFARQELRHREGCSNGQAP
jgi:hypothetical protein